MHNGNKSYTEIKQNFIFNIKTPNETSTEKTVRKKKYNKKEHY